MNYKIAPGHRRRYRVIQGTRRLLLGLILILLSLAVDHAAQDMPELAPPPLKIISKDEQSKLKALDGDVKARTRVTLELMDRRLDLADRLADGGNYDLMFGEIGGFHGLMDDAVQFLRKGDLRSSRVLDTLKRLEIGLRGFAPRLEEIRRELPLRYEDYVRRVILYVRDARTKATEPFFADTVIPQTSPQQ